jgi:diguanylate cyclase (GGDEF)-like protein
MATPSSFLIGLVGATSQLGGLALLVVLFVSLRDHARRTSYFASWKRGWIAALVGIAAVSLRYSAIPAASGAAFQRLGESSGEVRLLYLVYQVGKLLFLASLVHGTRAFVRGRWERPSRTVALSLLGAYAAASVLLAPTLNHVVLWQSALAVPAFGWCAAMLHSLPRARRSLGTIALGLVCLALAALWSVYAFGFGWYAFASESGAPNPVQMLLTYNSYVDSLMQMLLGYGMVIVLMEDATRVIAAAHGELAAAHDQLRRQALFDPLTGALNRRAFDERLGLERVLATFGTVAMIDLDDLKPINDTHGHAVGDAMLRHLVAALSPRLRATDKVYRWGGDEFLVLLPGSSQKDALARIASLLGAAPSLGLGELSLPLRASVGAAEYRSADDLHAAVSRADAAMYAEKISRRESASRAVRPTRRRGARVGR